MERLEHGLAKDLFFGFGSVGCVRDCKGEFLFDNIDLPTMLAA